MFATTTSASPVDRQHLPAPSMAAFISVSLRWLENKEPKGVTLNYSTYMRRLSKPACRRGVRTAAICFGQIYGFFPDSSFSGFPFKSSRGTRRKAVTVPCGSQIICHMSPVCWFNKKVCACFPSFVLCTADWVIV